MLKKIILLLLYICLLTIFSSCKSISTGETKTAGVQEGVHQMADAIVRDLHNEGPIVWLKYFSNSKQFFMVSNGMLVFPNIDSASAFVPRLAKQLKRIELKWDNIRVDSLAPDLGIMAASFHEILISATGAEETSSGYFTGVVENTPTGWKLRDANWSIASPTH